MQAARDSLKDSIAYHNFVQFKFFEQWKQLRKYANDKNIQIVGDISIYVCHNSSDVWSSPEIFKLDPQTFEPTYIAGVPQIISVLRDNYGEILSITGINCNKQTLLGGFNAFKLP